ncbi:hypothetical protein SLS53_002746 [Cytospora paraplurivora]|uniref:Chitin synthase activator n=1 Tax=Cytospora paraplurivora TaxID=2898453 RepID=A0AAN9UKS7_9PEZI
MPQVMPEVPQNMQQGIQRMEIEAGHIQSRSNYGAPNYLGDPGHDRGESQTSALSGYTDANSSNYRPFEDDQKNYHPMASLDLPGKNPFPRLQGDNIPPSDDEKEEILYNAREHVLHSNNVNMQLSWARDALNFVETAAEVRARDDASRNGGRSQTPAVEHELRVDAMNIIMYLSEQRHPEAVFMKAKWDEFGKFGTREDKRAAFKGYRTAAEQGWGRAEYRMGMLYENSNEFDKAISHYYNGEALGDSAAMYRLGMMALLGQHGQPQDFQQGLDWINRAADTADEDAPQGAYVFGMLIARDLPDIIVPEGMLPYKVDTARQYIEKAAYLGFAKAQLKMGQAYELCQLGCDFHPAYSLHYYGLASAQGQPEAALGVSRWFLFGYEGNFAKNEALAFKYAKQAADAQLPTGEFAMGYYHEIGIHVQKDLVEARRWYELAAAHGNTDAVGRLDSLSRDRTLSKQDHETTALTRIKSQHGSMKGKRPERLKRLKDQQHMAAVPEGPSTPNDPSGRSPRISPHPSPRNGPAGNDGRPPAFGLNVNMDQGLAMRPKSAAPYPENDTRPPPLNVHTVDLRELIGRGALQTLAQEDTDKVDREGLLVLMDDGLWAGHLEMPTGARPTPPSSSHGPGTASPAPSTASAPAPAPAKPSNWVATDHPDGKTMGNGPATFDEMGIPKQKQKDDCKGRWIKRHDDRLFEHGDARQTVATGLKVDCKGVLSMMLYEADYDDIAGLFRPVPMSSWVLVRVLVLLKVACGLLQRFIYVSGALQEQGPP